MDSSSFEDITAIKATTGPVVESSKCNRLSIEEKREIVYELAKWSDGAPEMLLTWTRQEILEVLCAEMGKERKYTGLTKLKIIENLLKFVSEKNSQENKNEDISHTNSFPTGERDTKRQRKNEHPMRVTMPMTNALVNEDENETLNFRYCENSACKAKLGLKDKFCKRCSCCICRKYDDNKDPSLWLTCCSDPPYEGDSCGHSCHLECALRNGKSGIGREGIDGNFLCVLCGKLNDLLGCWRKQLTTAKDTRRVDTLCYRILLSQRLLSGTKRYQKLYKIVDEAKSQLELEMGPLSGSAVKMARGIVNRLSSGPEVQSLCGLALKSLDSILSSADSNSPDHFVQEANPLPSNIIHLKDVSCSSVTVILDPKVSCFENISRYTIWHRKAEDTDYEEEPTCTLTTPYSSFLLSGLIPSTDYIIKVISYESMKELGMFELLFQTSTVENEVPKSNNMTLVSSQSLTTISSSLSNPSSVEDETNNLASNSEKEKANNLVKSGEISQVGNLGDPSITLFGEDGNGRNKEFPSATTNNSDLPITPCKLEIVKNNLGRNGKGKPKKSDFYNLETDEPQSGSSSKKRESRDEETMGDANSDFEYYVKVIRWLECEGHVEMNFRQKFLTWYSLRATPQEVRVVKVFVDTLIDDPSSLAAQLLDAFSDVISSKSCLVVPSGFCTKLWH